MNRKRLGLLFLLLVSVVAGWAARFASAQKSGGPYVEPPNQFRQKPF
jgi:hypothetical protein